MNGDRTSVVKQISRVAGNQPEWANLFARVTNVEESPVILGLWGSLDFTKLMHNFIDRRQMGECDEPFKADQLARSVLDFGYSISGQQDAISRPHCYLRS
jgi:hypothetical protein